MTGPTRDALVVAAAIAVDLLFWDGEVRLAGGGELPLWLPVLITVAVHRTLWWRRRNPLPVFGVQVGFAMVSVAVPLWQPLVGLLIATFAVAANTDTRGARWGWLVTVPLASHAVALGLSAESELVGVLQATALHLAAGAACWIAGRRVYRRGLQLRAWQADQDRLRTEATLNERVALARELHDGVANTITTVLVQAAAARAAASADPRALHGIEAAARRAMKEIQATLALMPRGPGSSSGPQLDDLPALLALAGEAGLDVRYAETGVRRALHADVQTAVYRAIQEGITNTLKYAPTGTRCLISLAWGADELEIDVIDEPGRSVAPRPALPPTGGRGLAGLGDRMRSVGGVVESGTHKDGFRLAARLPVGVR